VFCAAGAGAKNKRISFCDDVFLMRQVVDIPLQIAILPVSLQTQNRPAQSSFLQQL
jgi:hypothetical protein